jgi:hypothetical protein
MKTHRNAYILTTNPQSDRTVFSVKILKDVGFNVHLIQHIHHTNPVISNRISMQYIYDIIQNDVHPYAYVFEDDIDIHEKITMDEIIKYEKLSDKFFYLGICEDRGNSTVKDTYYSIYSHRVACISGNVRGLHAIGLSKEGARDLLEFSKDSPHVYMDMVLEDFSRRYPANIVRYDLQSNIHGHRGMFFQNRSRFPSTIST